MSLSRVHVIGAGLSGLSAAVELASAGAPVAVHEASPQAGGRCRSYFDVALDMEIDNGNHLVLSGNRATLAYAEKIGAPALQPRLRGLARTAVVGDVVDRAAKRVDLEHRLPLRRRHQPHRQIERGFRRPALRRFGRFGHGERHDRASDIGALAGTP